MKMHMRICTKKEKEKCFGYAERFFFFFIFHYDSPFFFKLKSFGFYIYFFGKLHFNSFYNCIISFRGYKINFSILYFYF